VKAETRIWKTNDGRHVLDGDRDAAVLAFAVGDDVPDEVVAELTDDVKPAAKKAQAKPADKQAPKPNDK
jgi:hypothetical protein